MQSRSVGDTPHSNSQSEASVPLVLILRVDTKFKMTYNRDTDLFARNLGIFQDIAALGKFLITGIAICISFSGSTPALSGMLGSVSISSMVSCPEFVYNVTGLNESLVIPTTQMTQSCEPSINASILFYAFLCSMVFFFVVFVGTVCLNRRIALARHSKKVAACVAAFTLLQSVVMFGAIFTVRELPLTFPCTMSVLGAGGAQQSYQGYCAATNFTEYVSVQQQQQMVNVPVTVPCNCEVSVPHELWILSGTLLLSYVYLVMILAEYVKKAGKKLGID